jgi:argininosuccinate lyase
METAEFDVSRMAQRAEQGWITVTELADTLARDHGVPFRSGHAVASAFIAAARSGPERPLSGMLRDASREVLGREILYDEAALTEVLSPWHFVEVRKTLGGPASSETARACRASHDLLNRDTEWIAVRRAVLERAAEDLKRAAAAI